MPSFTASYDASAPATPQRRGRPTVTTTSKTRTHVTADTLEVETTVVTTTRTPIARRAQESPSSSPPSSPSPPARAVTTSGCSSTAMSTRSSSQLTATTASPPPPGPSQRLPPLRVFPSQLVKVYRPIHPSRLRTWDGPAYLCTRAEVPGVYRRKRQVEAVTEALGHMACWEKRPSCTEAKALYTRAYNRGEVSATPVSTGPYTIQPYDLKPFVRKQLVFRPSDKLLIQKVEHLVKTEHMHHGKYYVVYKGEEVGVYGSWHEVFVRIENLRKLAMSDFDRFDTWEQAEAAYKAAYDADQLFQTPLIGGPFDTQIDPALRSL
ncbi:hypothetical protein CVT26_005398 [Gymnopilus dilepis]|uniref:Ribonuclease H1 N-terminal domain-containing protein n=1 Tax=Gymnopilus dilepis TaxID=231916 RepID=A0A409WGY8_9AGAR|nr:hypothetical protein CVT26_005398 [Gymnopilus dilepis]